MSFKALMGHWDVTVLGRNLRKCLNSLCSCRPHPEGPRASSLHGQRRMSPGHSPEWSQAPCLRPPLALNNRPHCGPFCEVWTKALFQRVLPGGLSGGTRPFVETEPTSRHGFEQHQDVFLPECSMCVSLPSAVQGSRIVTRRDPRGQEELQPARPRGCIPHPNWTCLCPRKGRGF